jgi:Fe2+ or Zn2+ uptake regulation protein
MARQNRNTKQKEIIRGELNKISSFFNAEELFNKVNQKDTNIGIATIYRFLNDAQNNGELFAYTCDRKKVYSKGKKSHCHFVCEKTGKIIHFDIDNIDFLKDKIPGNISSFQLEVKGVCTTCDVKK